MAIIRYKKSNAPTGGQRWVQRDDGQMVDLLAVGDSGYTVDSAQYPLLIAALDSNPLVQRAGGEGASAASVAPPVVGTELAYAEATSQFNPTLTQGLVQDLPGLTIGVPASTGPYWVEARLPLILISFAATATAATPSDLRLLLVDELGNTLDQQVVKDVAGAASAQIWRQVALRKRMPATTTSKTLKVQVIPNVVTNVAAYQIWAGTSDHAGIAGMGPMYITAITR